jgi:signal peptidase II
VKRPFFLIAIVLLLDQLLKVYIKLTMTIGQEFPMIGDWAIIHFTENNGMAF